MISTSRNPSLRLTLLAIGLAFASLVGTPAPGDDKPKPGKGSPSGETYGGTGGEPFRDRAEGKLASIKVRAGSFLDSVQCLWTDPDDKPAPGDAHGGDGGEETVLKMEDGEYLVKISGVVLKADDVSVIGSLTLKTNKRTLGPYGEATDGEKFEIEAPKGEEICGFRGRSGEYLDAIGIVTRPLPKP